MNHARALVRERGDRTVVELAGELDLSSVSVIEQELLAIEASSPRDLVLDLRGLSFIDSSGLRLILETDSRARIDGRVLELIPGSEKVHRVFLITLLDRRLNFVTDGEFR
jgi:anti-sigma B factor antagonist